MKALREQRGYTLIELLVTMALFAVASTAFLQVLLMGTRGANTAKAVDRISEEARLGLNRVIRDTRQASGVEDYPAPSATSYTIDVDFNGDGQIGASQGGGDYDPNLPNDQGDYERETFAYNSSSKVITIQGGNGPTYTLISGVTPVSGTSMFTYFSNHLEYDWNSDGVTDLSELQSASSHGVSIPDPYFYVSDVAYAIQITNTGRSTTFYGEAELRNLS
jgi:prepilin-type N-terminal cleavage/methylation domain-containing protein